MIERKIYNDWAFTENEQEKGNINREIYKELQDKYKILKISAWKRREPSEEELKNNDIVYSRKACYKHGEYKIYKCPEEITFSELALICDNGNLCFGCSGNKSFINISED